MLLHRSFLCPFRWGQQHICCLLARTPTSWSRPQPIRVSQTIESAAESFNLLKAFDRYGCLYLTPIVACITGELFGRYVRLQFQSSLGLA